MNGFFLLLCLAFLAFFSPATAFELNSNGAATFLAAAINYPSADISFTHLPKIAATFLNTFVYKLDFKYTDLFTNYFQEPLASFKNYFTFIWTDSFNYFKLINNLPVACNVPASQQVNAKPNSGHTHHLIWAYMFVLTMLFCGTCIVIYIQRQTIEELIKAHNELTFVVHNMPYSPFSISTNKHTNLSNVPAQSDTSTDNTTFDDSGNSVAETSTIVSDAPNNKGRANRANQKYCISIKKLMAAKP